MITLLCLASKAAQCLVTAIPERPILLKKGKNLAVFTTESWLFRSQNLVTQLVFSYNVILIITTTICDLSPIFLDLSVGSKVRQEFPKPCGIHQKCQKSMLSLQKSWEWDSSYTAVVATPSSVVVEQPWRTVGSGLSPQKQAKRRFEQQCHCHLSEEKCINIYMWVLGTAGVARWGRIRPSTAIDNLSTREAKANTTILEKSRNEDSYTVSNAFGGIFMIMSLPQIGYGYARFCHEFLMCNKW